MPAGELCSEPNATPALLGKEGGCDAGARGTPPCVDGEASGRMCGAELACWIGGGGGGCGAELAPANEAAANAWRLGSGVDSGVVSRDDERDDESSRETTCGGAHARSHACGERLRLRYEQDWAARQRHVPHATLSNAGSGQVDRNPGGIYCVRRGLLRLHNQAMRGADLGVRRLWAARPRQ